MNKVIKRALAGVAAFGIAASGLVLGGASAYADDSTTTDPTTGSITINKSNEEQIDHTFSGWHLASLTNIVKNEEGNISGFLIDTDDKMVTSIVSAMTQDQKTAYEADSNYYSADNTVANPMGYLVDKVFKDSSGAALDELTSPWGGDSSTLRAFAKSLSEKLAAKGAPTATKSDIKTGTNENLTQGLWFLKDVTADNDAKGTNSIPIITPTTFDGAPNWGTVTLKNTTPTIDKKLVDGNATDGYTANTQPDYAVGDTVTYELTSTIPVFTGYDIDPEMKDTTKTRIFQIKDTADAALTVTEESVVESVKLTPANGGAAVTLTKDTDYTVKVEDYTAEDAYKGGHVTTIDLGRYVNKAEGSTSATAGILEGSTVTVIVKATLNNNAKISEPNNLQKNLNKVALNYSNKPESVNDAHEIPGPEVPVYAYKFGIKKTDKAGATMLEGAKFTIKVVSGASFNNGKYLGTAPTANSGWTYLDGEPAADATSGVFTTDKDGVINVSGLDAGTYEVHEIAPPAGYTAVGLPKFQFTIAPTVNDGDEAGRKTITAVALNMSGTVKDDRATLSQDGKVLNIWNAKNITELPKTGGAGLAMIMTVGVLCIAAAGVFGIRARRNA